MRQLYVPIGSFMSKFFVFFSLGYLSQHTHANAHTHAYAHTEDILFKSFSSGFSNSIFPCLLAFSPSLDSRFPICFVVAVCITSPSSSPRPLLRHQLHPDLPSSSVIFHSSAASSALLSSFVIFCVLLFCCSLEFYLWLGCCPASSPT